MDRLPAQQVDDSSAITPEARAALGAGANLRQATNAMLRRILRNAGTLLGGKLAMGLVNLAATGVAMRAMGVDNFGLLILIHTFAQASASFIKFQSWQAVIRYGSASLEKGNREDFRSLVRFTTWLDAGSGVVCMVLCAGLVWFFGGFFDIPPAFATSTALYATCTVFMVMATPIGLLRLFDRFDVLATRDTLGALFRLGGAFLGGLLGWGLAGFLVVWYLATAIGGLALAYAAWHEMRKRGLLGSQGVPIPPAEVAHPGIWSFVWSTNITTTLSLASGNLGTLCVGGLLGPAEAALFSVARQIGEAALRPGRFLSPAIFPELARLSALGDTAGISALLRKVLAISTAASIVLLAALALLGEWLLRLVGGVQAVPAFPVMLMLGVASAIGFAVFALEPLLISTGRQNAALRARMIAAILYVPAALVGIHVLGLDGAGWASIAMAIVMLLAQVQAAFDAILARKV